MRVHLFPSRTQKLSSFAPTILGGRLPGKIGNANTSLTEKSVGLLLYPKVWEQVVPVSIYGLCVDCDEGPPVSCWGTPASSLATERLPHLPTPATRSPRFICRWQRSHRSPGKIGNANTSLTTSVVRLFSALKQGLKRLRAPCRGPSFLVPSRNEAKKRPRTFRMVLGLPRRPKGLTVPLESPIAWVYS